MSLGEGDHFVTATTIEEHRHAINQKQLTESIDLKMVLQQKADPWDMTGLDRELASEIRRRKGAASEDGLQIILVASLLEKAPNLGGLCRTAEIMGASKLIVANASIVKDSTFSAVSMTAEQWIDIEAVLPSSLCSYLVSLKSEDYRVIAVEQASITSSLERFQLPSNGRVCLVLGNERFGIPVEVLHVADECVTIPQFGLVRSLNAHVAGALVMWEMRRQFTVNSCDL